jgi:DNA-binding response OmpR family regulator
MARILVVEDADDVRALVVRRVQNAGHQVLSAADGAQALQMVRERGAPEAVVLDVGLPDTDGLTLLGQLRAETDRSNLPAVFLSGRIEPSDIEAGRALGARYLTKPFVNTALQLAINDVLEEAAGRGGAGGW